MCVLQINFEYLLNDLDRICFHEMSLYAVHVTHSMCGGFYFEKRVYVQVCTQS